MNYTLTPGTRGTLRTAASFDGVGGTRPEKAVVYAAGRKIVVSGSDAECYDIVFHEFNGRWRAAARDAWLEIRRPDDAVLTACVWALNTWSERYA